MSSPLSSPAEAGATHPPASLPPSFHRLLLGGLALAALLIAWSSMGALSRNDPWYDHADTNVHNMVDALALNSNVVPSGIDQPGFTTKYLLAAEYRVRHYLGLLPVWNLKKFGDTRDPLREIPPLLQIGRTQGRVLVLIFILTGAGLVYSVSRNPESFLLAVMLLSASAGLLYHGLGNRPELLCAWFGAVVAPFCVWQATSAGSGRAHALWLFLTGLAVGLAILTKLPGFYYLIACHAWCWLAATTEPGSGPGAGKIGILAIVLPVSSSAAFFWLMSRLAAMPGILTAVALVRIHSVAIVVGVLPLLALIPVRRASFLFLRTRLLELAGIGGGALAAVLAGYGALCAVLTEPRAAEYLARLMQFVAQPDALLDYLLTATPAAGPEFLLFVRESPVVYAGAVAATVAACLARPVARKLRAFIALLLFNAIALTWIMAHGRFLDQFSIFAHVPLLLACPLGLFALGIWPDRTRAGAGSHWAAPVVITGATVLCLTVFFRLEPKHRLSQTEVKPPVNELTRTILFDHGAHPERYRQIMHEHYGSREQFAAALAQFLSDPAHSSATPPPPAGP